MYVPKHYRLDIKTEDVLIDGTHLRNGMQVLVEEDQYRSEINTYSGRPNVYPGGLPSDAVTARANKYNRWCEISKLQITESNVKFIGYLEDEKKVGYLLVFEHPIGDAWYVKNSSRPSTISFDNWNMGYRAGLRVVKMELEKKLKEIEEVSFLRGYVEGVKAVTSNDTLPPYNMNVENEVIEVKKKIYEEDEEKN